MLMYTAKTTNPYTLSLSLSLSLSHLLFQTHPLHLLSFKKNLILYSGCLPSIELKVGWVQVIIHLIFPTTKKWEGLGFHRHTQTRPWHCSRSSGSHPGMVNDTIFHSPSRWIKFLRAHSNALIPTCLQGN